MGAIAQFRSRHPFVDIELTSSYSGELALKDRQSDIVIADSARVTQAPKSFMSKQLIWRQPFDGTE